MSNINTIKNLITIEEESLNGYMDMDLSVASTRIAMRSTLNTIETLEGALTDAIVAAKASL